jgi:hypothetical protein
MTTITLETGKTLNVTFSVLETLAVNGYKDAMIITKGLGSCKDKDGNWLRFEYTKGA